jgi:valyl-tRNA synthetase
MNQFRLSEALKTIYSLIWDDFCSSYLEWVKPSLNLTIYRQTIDFFEELMQLLHPFMPFITEEIYHLLIERIDGDDICIKQVSSVADKDILLQVLENGDELKNAIRLVKESKAESKLKKSDSTILNIKTAKETEYQTFLPILTGLTGSTFGGFVDERPPNTSIYGIIDSSVIYGSPSGGAELAIKENSEELNENKRKKLLEELEYQKSFLASVEKKLSNERFVQNAKPEVIALEQKKKADAEARIRTIEESLSTIS